MHPLIVVTRLHWHNGKKVALFLEVTLIRVILRQKVVYIVQTDTTPLPRVSAAPLFNATLYAKAIHASSRTGFQTLFSTSLYASSGVNSNVVFYVRFQQLFIKPFI